MKRSLVIYLLLFAQILLLTSCSKQVSKRITLWRNDKIPYGTFYAYENLPHLFTDAVIETTDESPVAFYREASKSSAYIIVSFSVLPDEQELKSIVNYAINGNHVFISAARLGEGLLDSFRLKATSYPAFYLRSNSLTIKLNHPITYDSFHYSYPGYAIANHFTEMDSSVTEILGTDSEGRANFVKLRYQGGGAVYFHLAPAAFTNFFLLHKENKSYYDLALSAIPDSVDQVKWDDYFRHHSRGRSDADKSAFNKLSMFLNDDMLSWAFWLTVVLFALVYLVESKRKQRAIPVIKKLNNSSLDFVKTVGRLYYQRKDNKNLAQKIAAHFLGHVRTRYNLPTSNLNEAFEERLAYKSGYPLVAVKEVINEVRSLELMYDMSDEELLAFNEKIDKFINKPH